MHKQLNMIKNYIRFFNKIKVFKLYLIEFNKNGTIKNKTYLLNCIINYKDYLSIIVITHNKWFFL